MPITQNILVPPVLWRVKFSKRKKSSNRFLIARKFNFSRAARRAPFDFAQGSLGRALPPEMLNDECIEHVSSVGTRSAPKAFGADCNLIFDRFVSTFQTFAHEACSYFS